MGNKDKQNDLIRYFSDEGFARLLAAARRKYESLGRIGGSVRLSRLKEIEREKLSGLLSRNLSHRGSLTVRLQELDEILLASRFEIDLLSLLHLLYGEEIKSKSVQETEAETAWKDFVSRIRAKAEKPGTRNWLSEIEAGRSYGYRTFCDVFERVEDDPGAEINLHAVIRGLDQLPVRREEKCPLPIFAAAVAGDPHFFDRDQLWGRLFYYGLLSYLNESGKENANDPSQEGSNEKAASYRVRKRYEQAGILLDALSSHILVVDVSHEEGPFSYAMTLDTIERLLLRWEEIAVGRQKDRLDNPFFHFIRGVIRAKHVFVSENPSVCEALTAQLKWPRESGFPRPQILCTSGQPSVAALALLDFFTAHGVIIHYSGDLDVKGLEMAISLEERYREHWQPWGMTATVARKVRATDHPFPGVVFSEQEQRMLQKLHCPWDSELVDVLLGGGQKVYQEMFVDELIAEYERLM